MRRRSDLPVAVEEQAVQPGSSKNATPRGEEPSGAAVASGEISLVGRRLAALARNCAIAVLVLAVIVGIWDAVTVIWAMPADVLPPPLLVARTLWDNGGVLASNTKETAIEMLVGFLLAGGIGVLIGALIARTGHVARAARTGVLWAQLVPKVAIGPLFVAWFGIGYSPKFVFVFLMCFFPVAINSAAGFSSLPADVRDLSHILNMSRLTRLRRLELPWALPQILTGLKISASFAVVAALVYEFVGSDAGLGYVINTSQGNLNMALAFAAFVVVTALGMLLYGAVALAETLLIPWHVSKRSPN
jgi:NitT/TauT family transport system permease protein